MFTNEDLNKAIEAAKTFRETEVHGTDRALEIMVFRVGGFGADCWNPCSEPMFQSYLSSEAPIVEIQLRVYENPTDNAMWDLYTWNGESFMLA